MPPQSPVTTLDPSPSDAVTRVCFSPSSATLLVSTWSGSLSLHSAQTGHLTSETRAPSAVLDATFLPSASATLAAATLSGAVLYATQTESALSELRRLGSHDAPARAAAALPAGQLATGGWDSTVRVWDPRAAAAAAGEADVGGRVYGMCAAGEHGVAIVTSERRLQVLDVRKLEAVLHDRAPTMLKYQLRGVSASVDGKQVVVGGTEGRVAVEVLERPGESYSFRCHRVDGLAFPVNCIRHNRKYGSFATAGADGHVAFWDGEARKRIAQYPRYPTSVASIDFDAESERIAIAVSYTFEEGEKDHPPDEVHVCALEDAHIATKKPPSVDGNKTPKHVDTVKTSPTANTTNKQPLPGPSKT